MGNSVIWYLPSGASFMTRIDFGRRINVRGGPRTRYPQTVQESLSGAQSSVIQHGSSVLSIGYSKFQRDAVGTMDALRRKLVTLSSHLRRGGSMVFAEDEATAFAGFATTSPEIGTTDWTVAVNLFDNLVTSPSATGRECTINSDFDRYLHEMLLFGTHSGVNVATTTGIVEDMTSDRWVMVREWGSWPALRVPLEYRDQEYVSHEQDRLFTFDLPLEEDVSQLEAHAASPGIPILGTEPGPVIPPDLGHDGIKDLAYGWDS